MLKTALLHHWLNGMRGGEKVFEIICDLFPDSSIYTLFFESEFVSERIKNHPITVSPLNKFSIFRNNYTNLFMLFPFFTEQFDLTKYDLIISSDTISMKGIISSPDSCHICYCHTPPRYVWDKYFEYIDNAGLGRIKMALARFFLHHYRQWDAIAANRVDYFIANSRYVAKRIAKIYRRGSSVVNPPVDISKFAIGSPGDYYLAFGQLVPYKRIDLLVSAFNEMPEKKLKIVGTGPLEKQLRKMAKNNIELIGWVDDAKKVDYFKNCRAFLFPGVEDYGITPVEAQACGRPVIAYGQGGVFDTVKGITASQADQYNPENHTGLFFEEQSSECIQGAIELFESIMEKNICPSVIRKHAEQYDEKLFIDKIRSTIDEKVQDFNKNGPPVFK